MANINTADIGFEKEIWKAADKMRGNIDASEYKSVVLGLIFLKYISDKFETKYRQLVDEGAGFEEDKDEYTAENIFYVPAEARWATIAAQAHTSEIGIAIDKAMQAIERENKRLKNILPKNFARPELDKRRLGDVVDLFTNIHMHRHGDSKDILGRTYEYCLSKFAEAEGKLAGEFYTPACVVRTLVEVLQPYNGRVYDPCCGSGGMFVQSAHFIESHQGNINSISVYGQDSNPTTWKMAQMNLAIRGIEADLVDCIVAMPPQLFYTTPIPVSIWFFNKAKTQPGHTLFIDARNLGTMVTRKLRELTDCDEPDRQGDIQRIADTYRAYAEGRLSAEQGFCAVATTEEIAAQDFILTPGRYVGIAAQAEDSEPFAAKMARLTGELSELFAESHALEAEIRRQLESIGYKLED